MPDILIATDAAWVHDDLCSVIAGPDTTIRWVRSGHMVLPAVQRVVPDLVIADFQIGNMGGMAVTVDLRLEEEAGRADHIAVLLLLDRRADVFLARRIKAEGFLVKPFNPVRIRKATAALLDGGTYHDESYAPSPTLVTPLPAPAPAPAS